MQLLFYPPLPPFSNYEVPIMSFLLWGFRILISSRVTETVFQYVKIKLELIKGAKPAHLLLYACVKYPHRGKIGRKKACIAFGPIRNFREVTLKLFF